MLRVAANLSCHNACVSSLLSTPSHLRVNGTDSRGVAGSAAVRNVGVGTGGAERTPPRREPALNPLTCAGTQRSTGSM